MKMIDLSFLTEAEQEAILKVLNRDAELKKADDERLRHLHDVVDDENEYKSKSGQWFYDAKSKRHREKIHGVDLVRASIRKRKKPATIELYGVMEPPDEAEEDIKVKKEEDHQSSKTVGVTSPERDPVNQKNGTIITPAKPRQNPFNSGGLQDYSDYNSKTSNQSPQNGQVNGTPKTKADLMSSLSKYGVKLPYPELIKGSEMSQKANDDSQQQTVQAPVPKPRTLEMNSELQDQPSFSIQKEDSYNGASKPRGILKRRSSTSSTDSESIKPSQSAESSKMVLPGSTILQAGRNNFSDESDSATDNSSDRLKQVRFSEKVHQRPPTPNPEPYSSKEIGEYGILDPGLSGADFRNAFGDHHNSGEPLSERTQKSTEEYDDSKIFEPKDNLQSLSRSVQPASLEVERNLEEPVRNLEEPGEGQNKMNDQLIKPKTSCDMSVELPTNKSTGEEPLYATVTKTPKTSSLGQETDQKPDVGSLEVSNSKQGMDDSHPILSALKRSAAKQLKSIEEVPPTSTNQLNSSNLQEHLTAPTENSFPENAEKFKRMSQSVPTFLQDETDGRDTDSASESSFQLGRHRKSPSSLTNLSISSGMASMSSVNGSVMSVYSGDFGNVDVKGGIEFSIDYVEQLKEFLIYIYQCKDLAAADVKRQRSDPYVKAYLLPEKAKMGKRKTAVKKKTLNPVYNEILRYKIPKEALLAQTLNLSVWHHDALGRNSFLGEVSVNLATWNWGNALRSWHQLEPRTPAAGIGLENRGEMKLALKYIPMSLQSTGSKQISTGEVHIWIKECLQLPMLRDNKINSFVKCTVLPDTSRKSRQKTRTVEKTTSPIFNHTMVYDGFKEEDLREACVELTVWDHNRLSNHFLGGLRVGLGTGKSYGTAVDWMDSSDEESTMWEKMMTSPNTWIEGLLSLRMFKMAKLSK